MMPASTAQRIESAVKALGDGPLCEEGIAEHVRPLFSRVASERPRRIYLANHSLGRPLDAVTSDVHEALACWYAELGGAWAAWREEGEAYRRRLARLLGALRVDSVIPKTSAGQGLRAVLNTWDRRITVVATRGEFDSIDVILREYAHRGRITLRYVDARVDGTFAHADIERAVEAGADLVVISPVMFQTGQRLLDLDSLVATAHRHNAMVLLDVYHALGALPLDIDQLDADFAVGGSYKYLRGGPGACFLYVHPRHLDAGLRTLDIGWFAKDTVFDYARPDPPRYAPGGDAWLESTPAILPLYQARAGQILALAIGVERSRAYNLQHQRELVAELREHGIQARGGGEDHGAFVVVRDSRVKEWVGVLASENVVVDARGDWLRLCPDLLTTWDELVVAARCLGRAAQAVRRDRG